MGKSDIGLSRIKKGGGIVAEFYTRVNGDEGTYQITFTTYDKNQYEAVQELCREFIGHKKPVYPTWAEWLTERGILISPVPIIDLPYLAYSAGPVSCNHIPAKIAEKLGIEPKEG